MSANTKADLKRLDTRLDVADHEKDKEIEGDGDDNFVDKKKKPVKKGTEKAKKPAKGGKAEKTTKKNTKKRKQQEKITAI